MARLKKKTELGPRYFVISPKVEAKGGEPAESAAFFTFDDATSEDVADYRSTMMQAQSGNQGVFLDKKHRAKARKVLEDFALERVKSAHGFEVEETVVAAGETPGFRELRWPEEKDEILARIPDGKFDLFKRTVEGINMPTSVDQYDNAALVGSRKHPNS